MLKIRAASSTAPTSCSSTIARPPDSIASMSRARKRSAASGAKQIARALADDIGPRDAEQALGRAVGEHVFLAVDVLDRDHGGDVLDDGVEELAGASDLGRGRLALRDLTKMLPRDEQADEPERDEQAEAEAGALQQIGPQERRRRHVDGERAHQIVETPMRVRLQFVVTGDAALFARERGIDRAEHDLAVGGQEFGLRFRRDRAGESLDRRRHGGVGRRGLDFPAGTADPAQAEHVVAAELPGEGFDGMGAKRRGDRRARRRIAIATRNR